MMPSNTAGKEVRVTGTVIFGLTCVSLLHLSYVSVGFFFNDISMKDHYVQVKGLLKGKLVVDWICYINIHC